MKQIFVPGYLAAVLLCLCAIATHFAQSPQESDSSSPPSVSDVFDRSARREMEILRTLTKYTPLVETYLQLLEPDKELGEVPSSDRYFLGKLDLKKGVGDKSLLPEAGFRSRAKDLLTQWFSVRYVPAGFAQMIFVDDTHFDRANYDFGYVRREFLGEVRCFVFDVKAKPTLRTGFTGRIWVEDQNYNIVRFNGTYAPSSGSNLFFHFDSWRENMGPGLWLPAFVYVEESDYRYLMNRRKLRFKGQTRIWGYDIGHSAQQEELTSLSVDSDQVRDDADATINTAPVQNLRAWEREAEDNVLNRLQNAGLLAPEGPANRVLETVLSNIEITNNLDIQPSVRARVLLTTPIESFAVGHTVVLSRGLVDVLPDEASLATVLAHELAHISLGHQIDTKYAFNDRMLFTDEETFSHFWLKRDEKEEAAADKKAAEFMEKSPYKDKLGNAGLFLRALNKRSAALPNLLEPHMGNYIARNGKLQRMPDLLKIAPALEMGNLGQIAALPLGSRLRVDPWNDTIELLQAKPASLLTAHEKMPFEVAPVFLHLTRQKAAVTAHSAP
jgi:hypothetical protein